MKLRHILFPSSWALAFTFQLGRSIRLISNSAFVMKDIDSRIDDDPVFHHHQHLVPITLVTFDVDGTLVRGSASAPDVTIHAKAFLHAVGKVMKDDENALLGHYTTPLDIIPKERYHGCTDGLISLNLIKYGFNISSTDSSKKLKKIFQVMFDYVNQVSDDEIARTILPIEGVIENLKALKQHPLYSRHTLCGLVTGNVEGIARRKMRATGLFHTGIFSPPTTDQTSVTCWQGTEDCAILGGFGSDYCSHNIDDLSRQYKDRGEQIAIAYRRALQLLQPNERIVRVVHVGDAPADVLAAKYCALEKLFGPNVVTSCIAVTTGSYDARQLNEACGETIPHCWEPVLLHGGVADQGFIDALKIKTQLEQTTN
eukprot:gene4197-4610_t